MVSLHGGQPSVLSFSATPWLALGGVAWPHHGATPARSTHPAQGCPACLLWLFDALQGKTMVQKTCKTGDHAGRTWFKIRPQMTYVQQVDHSFTNWSVIFHILAVSGVLHAAAECS